MVAPQLAFSRNCLNQAFHPEIAGILPSVINTGHNCNHHVGFLDVFYPHMLTREILISEQTWRWQASPGKAAVARPSVLYFVTSQEVQELDDALGHGRLPVDLEWKLCRLRAGNLTERYVEQNSRLLFELLLANEQGLFRELSVTDRDRLLRLLAYVRKDEDLVPDYRRDGFKDDAQEMRAAEAELLPLIKKFKAWRLRHQVPALWLRAAPQFASPRDAAC